MTSSTIKILLIFNLYKSMKLNEDNNLNRNYCRERDRLIESDNADLYTLIDAMIGQKLTLQCHFCNENDDGRPKIWYKIENLANKTLQEVKLDMNNDNKMNKIHVNSEHSLILNNFTLNDTGLYLCLPFEQTDTNYEKYNYLIDIIFGDENNKSELIKPERGNFTDWRQYHQDSFVPINLLFQKSENYEFVVIRNYLHLEMELVTQWLPWGVCEVCGRPNNEGVRRKVGLCRIKLTRINNEITSSKSDETFLLNANVISCRSQLLYRLFPGVSNLTRIIPNFVQIQPCQGICNPDAEGLAKGWKANKKFAFKYRKRFVLNEGENLIIVCPESTLENIVIWRKGSKILETDKGIDETDEPLRVFVDTFNTLYLLNVIESESGNYSCQVDNVRMQQITINVISKSRILTQLFVRHLIYLGIILSLTTSCYCAGIVITFSRKSKFKGYKELKEMDTESY